VTDKLAHLKRVQDYLGRGYSARRVAELIGWQLWEVEEMKQNEDFVPTTRRDRAVHMVLRGKTVAQAARAVELPIDAVTFAVEEAKAKIAELAIAARNRESGGVVICRS
jgi:hypothetical protein